MISYSFPPKGGGGVLRQLKFAKYLPELGWQPFILTTNKRYAHEDAELLDELSDLCYVVRTGGSRLKKKDNKCFLRGSADVIKNKTNPLSHIFRIISRFIAIPDRFIFWALFMAIPLGLKIIRENNIELIYSIDNPHSNHIAALILSRISGKPWVADFKDPWTKNFGYEKARPFSYLDIFLEKAVLKNARHLICVNISMKNEFTGYLNNSNTPISIIPNGYDEKDFYKTRKLDSKQNKLTIGYTGTIYHDMFPYVFLDVVHRLVNERKIEKDEIKIIFSGVPEFQGDLSSELIKELEYLKIFEYKGQLSHKDTIEMIMQSHILLLALSGVSGSSSIIPSKTYEYIASGKFIIALTNPGNALSILTSNTKSGCTVPFNDANKIENILLSLNESCKNGTLEYRERMPEEIARYSRRNLTLELVKIFNTLVPPPRI